MRKVTCTVQKQQSVFERLLVMDCQRHSLEHCLIGLSGCQQQKRTLDTVTNQKLIFGVFFFTSLLFSAEQVLSRSTFSARGGGGGCDRTLRTPPPPPPPAYAPVSKPNRHRSERWSRIDCLKCFFLAIFFQAWKYSFPAFFKVELSVYHKLLSFF